MDLSRCRAAASVISPAATSSANDARRGAIVHGGARIRESADEHLGPRIHLSSSSTQEIARLVVQPSEAGPICHLKQMVDGKWLETSATPSGGSITRRELELPLRDGAGGGEFTISMFDARGGAVPDESGIVLADFSSPLPFGWAFKAVGYHDTI